MAEAPKKAPTAFWIWLGEHRAGIAKELGRSKGSDVAKAASGRWNSMSADAKKPWEDRAAEKKAQYHIEMQKFKDAGGIVERKRKGEDDIGKRKKKPADAPKKPVAGAFGTYLNENRSTIAKSLPAGGKMTDTTKKAVEQWKALGESEKAKYESIYQQKMTEYKAAMELYNGKDAETV